MYILFSLLPPISFGCFTKPFTAINTTNSGIPTHPHFQVSAREHKPWVEFITPSLYPDLGSKLTVTLGCYQKKHPICKKNVSQRSKNTSNPKTHPCLEGPIGGLFGHQTFQLTLERANTTIGLSILRGPKGAKFGWAMDFLGHQRWRSSKEPASLLALEIRGLFQMSKCWLMEKFTGNTHIWL